MTLSDFLELIKNLNENTAFYLRFAGQDYPLSKINIAAQECDCLPGAQAMTQKQIAKLVKKMHHRRLPLRMIINKQLVPAYGIQISIETGRATLM